jgi:Cu2+-exporting ATPase
MRNLQIGGLLFRTFGVRICFRFRVSIFGFPGWMVVRIEMSTAGQSGVEPPQDAAVSAGRGAVSAGHAAVCRHCGSPLLTEAARTSGFCCAGCAYVFRLVSEGGLDRYYTLKDKVIAPAGSALFQPRDYGWLEEMQGRAEIAVNAGGGAVAGGADPGHVANEAAGVGDPGYQSPEMVLDLQGISCVGCVWLIEKLFAREPGARRIEINAQLGRIRLTWKSGDFEATRFARTLQSFNYFLGPPGPEGAAQPESRDLAKRIGLCTAFAMNIMLFTLPAYFGMDASFPYARLFGTLAMVFGTLSFLAGGGYFLGRAVGAIRARVLHIDLPIALGILGAYGGSVYGWIATDGRFVYFDFVGSFILLMLVGRWAQVAAVERNRRQLLRHQTGPQRVRLYEGGRGATESAVPTTSESPSDAVGRARPPGAPSVTDGPAVRPYLENDLQDSPARTDAPLVAVGALQTGQVFGIPMGHTVPVEGRLVAHDGVFTTAWINGESAPRVFRAGQRVPAGAVNVTRGELRLEALQTWSESLLAKLLQGEVRPGFRHRRFERIIQGYLVGIIGLALAAGGAWAFASGDVQRALSVALSVLVVSCPCAIGLALPLADEMAVTALRRAGVFVRENDLWARLGRVRKIIFDKTGTLTLEAPGLANPEALDLLGVDDQRALLAMVRDNPHPVSQCLYEALLLAAYPGVALDGSLPNPAGRSAAGSGGAQDSAAPAGPAAGSVFEEIGAGVGLRIGGYLWTLGRPGWRGVPGRSETPGAYGGPCAEDLEGGALSSRWTVAPLGAASGLQTGQGEARNDVRSTTPGGDQAGRSEAGQTEFCRNGAVLARFRFADTVRADARVEIAALRAAGHEVFILSGDHQSKVDAMARELGLPEEHAAGDVSPEGKADWVRRHDNQDTLMLGDGANDSLAFTCAHCRGTPMVHRGALESKADFYYLGRGIGGIRRLLAVDRIRARTQRWVLGFAIAYNLAAVGFAVAGHMSPLLAAGLMPASALVSLAIVGLGMRTGSMVN